MSSASPRLRCADCNFDACAACRRAAELQHADLAVGKGGQTEQEDQALRNRECLLIISVRRAAELQHADLAVGKGR